MRVNNTLVWLVFGEEQTLLAERWASEYERNQRRVEVVSSQRPAVGDPRSLNCRFPLVRASATGRVLLATSARQGSPGLGE